MPKANIGRKWAVVSAVGSGIGAGGFLALTSCSSSGVAIWLKSYGAAGVIGCIAIGAGIAAVIFETWIAVATWRRGRRGHMLDAERAAERAAQKEAELARLEAEHEAARVAQLADEAIVVACFDCVNDGTPYFEWPRWFAELQSKTWGSEDSARGGQRFVCLWHLSKGQYERPRGTCVPDGGDRRWGGEAKLEWLGRMKREGKSYPSHWDTNR